MSEEQEEHQTALKTIAEAITASTEIDSLDKSDVILNRLHTLDQSINQPNDLLMQLCHPQPDFKIDLELSLLQFLLNQGANVDCVDKKGHTPLYTCVLHKQLKKAEWLLKAGAKTDVMIDEGSKDGENLVSCLSKAASLTFNLTRVRDYRMVLLLLKYGASVKLAPRIGFIVLRDRQLDVMQLLVKAGLDPKESLGYSDNATLLESSF